MNRNNNDRPWRDFARQSGPAVSQAVNTVFREPVHQVLEKIKNESYFKWPNKMSGKPLRRNQSLHCSTIRSEDIPLRTVEHYGTIWSNWLEREGCNNFYTDPMDKETSQG